MDNKPSSSDPGSTLRAAWATRKPARLDYAAVVNEIKAAKLVGEASIFVPGPHVPITHMAYLKPPVDAFNSKLKSKDRRSGKEWEYVNSAFVWL